MVLAVLAARFGLNLGDKEVYLNIAGGLMVDDPAADLSVILALISAARDFALPNNLVAIGEVGLSGEVRMVANIETRLKEAEKLGFQICLLPKAVEKLKNWQKIRQNFTKLNMETVSHLRDLAKYFQRKI